MVSEFAPALLRARADWRKRWLTFVVVVALVGVVFGGLLAATAGARRTGSAYDRLRQASAAPDMVVTPRQCDESDTACRDAGDAAARRAALRDVGQHPGVRGVAAFSRYSGVFAVSGRSLQVECDTGSGELSVLAPSRAPAGEAVQRPVILEGRAADPDRADEVVIGIVTRDDGVRIGDTIEAELGEFCPVPGSPPRTPIQLHVVGVAADTIGLRPEFGSYFRTVYATDALQRWAQEHEVSGLPVVFARLDAGLDPAEVIPSDGLLEVAFTGSELRSSMQRSIQPDVVVLVLIAALGSAFMLLVLAPAMVRIERDLLSDAAVLRTIGFTRGDFARVGLLHGIAIAVPAALLAMIVASGLSPLTPLGDAAAFEPSPGFAIDWVVLGAGGVAIIATVLALTTITATVPARAVRIGGQRLGSRIADRLHVSPVGHLGLRFALDAATGRAASGAGRVFAQVIGVAAVVGALTFTAGLDHLRTEPRLVGWNWDIAAFPDDSGDGGDELVQALRATPGVERVGFGTFFSPPVVLGAERVPVWLMSLEAGPSSVPFAVIDGRSPAGDRELLVHPSLLTRLALRIGDTTSVHIGTARDSPDHAFTIVGTGVLPLDAQQFELAAAMTFQGLTDIAAAADLDTPVPDIYVADLDESVDVRALGTHLHEEGFIDAQGLLTGDDQVGQGLVDGLTLSNVERVPRVLAVLAAVLASVVLAHLLVARRRDWRRELAMHRVLGFTRGAVRRGVAMGAAMVALVVTALGIPIGLAVGRTAWIAYADSLGVKPEAAISWPWLGAVAVGAVIVAVVAAALTGLVADRRGITPVLRAE